MAGMDSGVMPDTLMMVVEQTHHVMMCYMCYTTVQLAFVEKVRSEGDTPEIAIPRDVAEIYPRKTRTLAVSRELRMIDASLPRLWRREWDSRLRECACMALLHRSSTVDDDELTAWGLVRYSSSDRKWLGRELAKLAEELREITEMKLFPSSEMSDSYIYRSVTEIALAHEDMQMLMEYIEFLGFEDGLELARSHLLEIDGGDQDMIGICWRAIDVLHITRATIPDHWRLQIEGPEFWWSIEAMQALVQSREEGVH